MPGLPAGHSAAFGRGSLFVGTGIVRIRCEADNRSQSLEQNAWQHLLFLPVLS
jgi:hypothetical protein